MELVKQIIAAAFNKVQERLQDAPTIEIKKFAENNILLVARSYADAEAYWDVYFNSYKENKKTLREADIQVAYPSRRIINV
jgi:small-conductance mechanosensitive channel